MDVYKINTSINITGNVTRELRTIFSAMENVEKAGKRVGTTISSWGGSIQRVISEVNHLAQAFSRVHGGNRGGFSRAALGFDAKTVLADVDKIQKALNGVKNNNGGVSRSFTSWAGSLERSATAAERLERALAGVRSHAPGGSPVRVYGPGGSGAPAGSGGARRGHRNHYAEEQGRAVGAVLGVGGGVHTLVEGAETGVDMRHIAEGMRQTGASDAQIGRAREIAFSGSRAHPNLSSLEIFEHISDLRGILGTMDDALNEAPHVLDEFSALKAKMGNKGAKNAVKQIYDAVRSAELANEIDGADVKKHVNTLIRQAFWFGDKLNPSEYFAAQKNAGQMLNLTEDEFKFGAFSALAQGIGQRAGTQFSTYDAKAAAGLRMTEGGLDEAARIGLLDEKTIKKTDSGHVARGAQFAHADEAAKNPFKYLFDHILPAMKKGGIDIDDDSAVLREFGKIYSDKNAYGFLFEMFKQRRKLIKDWDGVKGTSGDFSRYLDKDPWAALQGTQAQGGTLATALSDPVIPQLVENLHKLNDVLSLFSGFLEKHPTLAAVLGSTAAAGVGGAAAAGVTALGMLGVGMLPPIAIAVGVGATVSILGALIPWRDILPSWLLTPETDKEKKQAGLRKELEGLLPKQQIQSEGLARAMMGAGGEETKEVKEARERLKATTDRIQAIQKEMEALKEVAPAADDATKKVSELSRSLVGLASVASAAGSMIQQAAFTALGGAGGGLIQKASFGGGGLDGGLGRAAGGGGNGIVPPGVTGNDRNMLGLISKYESGGRNVMNYIGDRTHTAQGYYQITNSNWRKIAPRLGITAPNAMSASLADQARVAQHLLHNGKGIRNWSDYNPKLRGALQRGETYHGTSVPPPPVARDKGEQSVHLHVDGQKIASIVSRHQFRSGNRPATGANIADMSEVYPVVG